MCCVLMCLITFQSQKHVSKKKCQKPLGPTMCTFGVNKKKSDQKVGRRCRIFSMVSRCASCFKKRISETEDRLTQRCDEIKILQLSGLILPLKTKCERDLIKTHPKENRLNHSFLTGSRRYFSGVYFFVEIFVRHVVLHN